MSSATVVLDRRHAGGQPPRRRKSISFAEENNQVFPIETKEMRKKWEAQPDSETRSGGGGGAPDATVATATTLVAPFPTTATRNGGCDTMWTTPGGIPNVPAPLPASTYEVEQSIVWTWATIVVVFLIIFVVIAVIVFVIIRTLEKGKTFQPTRIHQYKKIRGTFYALPSGGLLVKYDCHPTEQMLHAEHHDRKRVRSILFLHGNTENLDAYADALECFRPLNYQFWALEYAGYGPTHPETIGNIQAPCAASMIQDVYEAWAICGSTESIIMGFSLGGGLLGEMYECLAPAPAQLVFLNTFASFPRLVGDQLPSWCSGFVQSCLSTQWETQPPCSYHGKVLIVYTCDDTSVPPEHGKQLCNVFCKIRPTCIKLPSGMYYTHCVWSNSC